MLIQLRPGQQRPWKTCSGSKPCLAKWVSIMHAGMSYQEQKARQGVSASAIFGFSLLFVSSRILAALYESWSLPFSVLLGTGLERCSEAFVVLWLRRTVGSGLLSGLHGATRE